MYKIPNIPHIPNKFNLTIPLPIRYDSSPENPLSPPELNVPESPPIDLNSLPNQETIALTKSISPTLHIKSQQVQVLEKHPEISSQINHLIELMSPVPKLFIPETLKILDQLAEKAQINILYLKEEIQSPNRQKRSNTRPEKMGLIQRIGAINSTAEILIKTFSECSKEERYSLNLLYRVQAKSPTQ